MRAIRSSTRLVGLLFAVASLLACGDSGSGGEGGDQAGMSANAGTSGKDGCEPPLIEAPGGHCYMPIPCPDTLPDFTLGLTAEGEEGLYAASIFEASPSPPRKFLNDWVIDLTDADGEPAADAMVIDDPNDPEDTRSYMPAHGHDGGRPIIIEAMDEPGRFSLSEINMFMAGPWEVHLHLTGPAGDDEVVFDICIED